MLWRTWFILGSLVAILLAARAYIVLNRDLPPDVEKPEVVRWLDEAGRLGNTWAWLCHQLGIELATWPAKMMLNFGAGLLFNGFGNSMTNITVRYTTVDNVPVTIFLPDNVPTEGKLPTMVYFHGGGWTWFSVDVYSGFLAHFSKTAKLQIIAVEYRKAPQHPFPAAYDDCLAVTLGLIKRTKDFRIAKGKLIVGGDGAGGNLAAAVAIATKGKILMQILINPTLQILDFETPSYQDNVDTLPGLSSAFRNIYHWLSYVGISRDYVHFALTNTHVSSSVRNNVYSRFVDSDRFLPKYLEVTKRKTKQPKAGANFIVTSAFDAVVAEPSVAPMMAVHVADVPNTYMVTSQYDVYRDEGIMYVNRLFDEGVKVKLEHYKSAFHGFLMFCGYGPIEFNVAKEAMAVLSEFIDVIYNQSSDQ